jgi:acyl-CoA synthetase (AMP-forming)/AMP-acid ligase II
MVGVGRPLNRDAVEVRLPDGSRAPDGVLGEVWLGGAILAEGYEGGDDFGAWLATGDVGCFRDGELFLFGRLVDSFNIRGQLITAPSAERKVQDALPEAGSLVVLPSRASGAGITVVVEAAQPWPPEVTEQARLMVSELFEHTEVDMLVVPPGGIPRTEQGKPRRKEAWARYVSSRGKEAAT